MKLHCSGVPAELDLAGALGLVAIAGIARVAADIDTGYEGQIDPPKPDYGKAYAFLGLAGLTAASFIYGIVADEKCQDRLRSATKVSRFGRL